MATSYEPILTDEAFERLWAESERVAWRIARRCGFSLRREDKEDMLQQIHLRAWKARHSFDPNQIASFDRWIARIATRTCLDSLRASVRERRVMLVDAPEREDGTTLFDHVPSDRPSALDEILAGEQLADLRRSMWEMPPTLRRSLDLTIQGLTPREIAHKTGAEVTTVRAQLVRARSWMRSRMTELPPVPQR